MDLGDPCEKFTPTKEIVIHRLRTTGLNNFVSVFPVPIRVIVNI